LNLNRGHCAPVFFFGPKVDPIWPYNETKSLDNLRIPRKSLANPWWDSAKEKDRSS
jgi:hypothetical protein